MSDDKVLLLYDAVSVLQRKLTPVYDPWCKSRVMMDLRDFRKILKKNGSVRAVLYRSESDFEVKLHVVTCKNNPTKKSASQMCRQCSKNTHHKCEDSFYIYILDRKELLYKLDK